MAQVNVEKLDKKGLRDLASKLGVTWDKRTDDEAALKKKVSKALEADAPPEKEDTAFDITRRAPTETRVDPKTKKPTKVPVACFGWLFNDKPKPGESDCKAACPHWKACKTFTTGAAAAFAELDAEEEAEAEADAVTAEDVELAAKATKKRAAGAKETSTLTKGEKRKSVLDEESELTVNFDLDWTLSVEDADLRKFYKRLVKKHGEGGKLAVSEVIDVFCEVVGLDDRGAVLTEMLPEMVANGDFVRV